MKTFLLACSLLFLFSCTKEPSTPEETAAALPSGYKLLVPKEVYINDQLVQANEYENGKLSRSTVPQSNGVAVYSYDEQNHFTRSEYTDPTFHAVTIDYFDEQGKLVKSLSNGEYLDMGGSFSSVSYYQYQNGLEIGRKISNTFTMDGMQNITEFSESKTYSGPKLSTNTLLTRSYFNGELVFENTTEQEITWQNAFDFTFSSGSTSTSYQFSPHIKSPYYHTGVITYPTEFKARDIRNINPKFAVNTGMLRTQLTSISENGSTQSNLKNIQLNQFSFPLEYLQEDVSRFGEAEFRNSSHWRFTYLELESRY